jgi:hypothetical protein
MNLSKHLWPAVMVVFLASCDHVARKHLEQVFDSWSTCELLAMDGEGCLTPAFALLYKDPLQVPEAAYSLCDALVSGCRNPETLLYHCYRLLGAPAGGYGPPLAGTELPARQTGYTLTGSSRASWETLPREFRSAILDFLQAWKQAEEVLQQFAVPLETSLNQQGPEQSDSYRDQLMEPWKQRNLSSFGTLDLTGEADLRKLSCASRLLASSLATLTRFAGMACPEQFESCVLETEMGQVKIYGGMGDTIDCGCGLVIDLGGDDLYRGNIASPVHFGHNISMVIDFGGDDSYRSEHGYLVNGSLGIGMLFDLSGDDLYFAGKAGLASSCYGTSLLYDRSGDDRYVARSAFSQGAAHLGAALLVDLEGDDLYCSSGESQGYGGTLGVGVLMDMEGDDRYNPENDSVSFVQGAGRGRWAEASDGHSLGGGIGIFVEAGGADRYYAGSFSQGASYFTGTGLFMDMEGNDHYQARSHSQGYAAHFALAGFFERKGDDHYNEGSDYRQITQLIGSGRDLSAGWFIDEEGDDSYHFGNRSAGVGDLNGLGILWDCKGRDSYTWHQNGVNAGSPSMGQTIALSEGMATASRLLSVQGNYKLGVFLDRQQKKKIIIKHP